VVPNLQSEVQFLPSILQWNGLATFADPTKPPEKVKIQCLRRNTFRRSSDCKQKGGVVFVNGLSRQHVQLGVSVRLVKDYLSVPAGTIATVHTINTPPGGNWHFTVRWKPHRPVAGHGRLQLGHRIMPMECSLNLSEEDLQLFEMAMDQDLLSPCQPFTMEGHSGLDVDQLSIPFGEE
jgi:hypothetical protein